MAFQSIQAAPFGTTHERQFFDRLSKQLDQAFGPMPEEHLLIGNVSVQGHELDALFIKPDGLTVLEFKNYGGRISFAENAEWCADTTIIQAGGQKNPYLQVRANKFALINRLKNFMVDGRELGHVTGVVVFHQPVELNTSLPNGIRQWFHVTDGQGLPELLQQITSPKMRFTKAELAQMPVWLGLVPATLSPAIDVEEFADAIDLGPLPHTPEIAFEVGLRKHLINSGFFISHEEALPLQGRDAQYAGDGLMAGLSGTSKNFIAASGFKPYVHQIETPLAIAQGKDVCLATSTASGKTLAFQLSAVELLTRDPKAVVLAIYPTKALGRQQVERWEKALQLAGIKEAVVSRIDGEIPAKDRSKVLSKATVVVMTPDVMHAWLMTNLQDKKVQDFLGNLRLLVLDEVHTYKGRMGSNMAYLMRRLNVQMYLCGNTNLRLLAASATLNDAEQFVSDLTGRSDFRIIDQDGAPSYPTRYYFVEPEKPGSFDAALQMFARLRDEDSHFRFLAFFDSRNQVSRMAQIANVKKINAEAHTEEENDPETAEETELNKLDKEVLKSYRIEPYRAGFSLEELESIMTRFTSGEVQGLMSTSALEIGIDLPDLNLGILFGVPPSISSLRQRIGRIGRSGPSHIIIMHDGSFRSGLMFSKPKQALINLPLEPLHLYLENKNLQVVQAQCLHAELESDAELPKELSALLPDSFVSTYRDLVTGQLGSEFMNLINTDQNPHHTYSLRESEAMFEAHPVIQGRVDLHQRVGKFSHSQVMREAYPGAIFRDSRKSYRVFKVNTYNRTLTVKAVKIGLYTKPIRIPKQITVSLKGETRFLYNSPQLKVFVADLSVKDTVVGYAQGSGGNPTTERFNYPIKSSDCDYPQRGTFDQRFNTRGFVIWHSALQGVGVQRELLVRYLLQNLRSLRPFDPQDIDSGNGKLYAPDPKTGWQGMNHESSFLSIFDQGNFLQLSLELVDPQLLIKALQNGLEFFQKSQPEPEVLREIFTAESLERDGNPFEPQTLQAMEELLAALQEAEENGGFCIEELEPDNQRVLVFVPGTVVFLPDGRRGTVNNVVQTSRNGYEYIIKTREPKSISRTVKISVFETLTPLKADAQKKWFEGDMWSDDDEEELDTDDFATENSDE